MIQAQDFKFITPRISLGIYQGTITRTNKLTLLKVSFILPGSSPLALSSSSSHMLNDSKLVLISTCMFLS